MKLIDIKPCPFCGGEAKVKKAPWDRSEEGSSVCEVYCTECHASIYGETFNFYQVKYDSDNPQDKISAIEKWNRRNKQIQKRGEFMSKTRVCCNCRHNIRTTKKGYVQCHCEISGEWLSYQRVMDGWCKHWSKKRSEEK